MTAPLTVIGIRGHRRVELFRAAAVAARLPEPAFVDWRDVCADRFDIAPGSTVRLESPGEDAEVDRLLRGADRPAEHGEIVGLAAWYAGLLEAARRVRRRASGPVQPPVGDLAVMFDKRRCHALLRDRGVPVPDGFAARDYEQVRAAGWGRVFVKPAHGSSASGVVALALGPGRVSAYTSAALDGGRLFNELRVHHYTDERHVAAIIDRLGADGLHVERWFPKASHEGRVFDLRVVVIAGRASHVVARTSRSPLTNLHLGNARGDLAAIRAAAGQRRWAEAMETCERAAACFPGSLHAGVDLMFAPGFGSHAVAEVNAFGDLLPGLLVDGRDTYEAEVAALTAAVVA
ncbi:STM4014 family protein [Dactylosporangium sp. NPDC000555]|uniref:STM4014 family protein n=1 Tax=Dactylosporangium sp. NPDC000555 TaxID=3154260 RepID=UPI00332E69E7